jgi:hypothetical protein
MLPRVNDRCLCCVCGMQYRRCRGINYPPPILSWYEILPAIDCRGTKHSPSTCVTQLRYMYTVSSSGIMFEYYSYAGRRSVLVIELVLLLYKRQKRDVCMLYTNARMFTYPSEQGLAYNVGNFSCCALYSRSKSTCVVAHVLDRQRPPVTDLYVPCCCCSSRHIILDIVSLYRLFAP